MKNAMFGVVAAGLLLLAAPAYAQLGGSLGAGGGATGAIGGVGSATSGLGAGGQFSTGGGQIGLGAGASHIQTNVPVPGVGEGSPSGRHLWRRSGAERASRQVGIIRKKTGHKCLAADSPGGSRAAGVTVGGGVHVGVSFCG